MVDFTAEVRRAAKVEVIAFDENQKEITSWPKDSWRWRCSTKSII